MAIDDDPRPAIDAACAALRSALVREFACACSRRGWDLIDDERVRAAIAVAERAAEGPGVTLEELDDARGLIGDAIDDRAREGWEAEADANFEFTPHYWGSRPA